MNTPRPSDLLFLRSLILTVGCFGAIASVQADAVVSNLTATQRAGTKLVDITYDLEAPGFGSVAVNLEASSDGGETWTVPVASATGAVGTSVTPGTGKSIAWNAELDWPQSYSTHVRFRVMAEDGFSYIPGGAFTMGRTSGDTDADAPSITVTVSPFYIQQTETTKGQWDEVRTWAVNNGYTDLSAGAGKASNHPVHSVRWWDVVKWCNARSEKEGLTPVYTVSGAVMRKGTAAPEANWSANGYRLPTEAEWEKAARGGVSGKRFPWGTDTISHAEANFQNNGGESYVTGGTGFHQTYAERGRPYTSPVGTFGANAFGLYDMAGNVGEWCWDSFGWSYYTTNGTVVDPRGPAPNGGRVVRGGGFYDTATAARCANRYNLGEESTGHFGLRPARSVILKGMVLIPGGSFTMGATSGDTDADAPSITVTVSPFYIQQTETTKGQWDEVRTWALNNGYMDLPVGDGKASNHPVQTVNWWDVVKWCNARSEKEGLTPVYTVSGAVMRTGATATEPVAHWSANGYRLPTEAEWEKAARGGVSGKRFPWGTDTINHAQANYTVYSQNETANFYSYDVEPRPPATGMDYYHPSYRVGGFPYTSPVGSSGANGYGLTDMAGNANEWCWDWYGSSYYATSNGTTDPRGPTSGSLRVLRGGSWNQVAFRARCALRLSTWPGNSSTYLGGFRPARTPLGTSIPQTESLTMDTRDSPLSSNADLTALTLSNGNLSPTFVSGTTAYTARVSNTNASVTVTPTISQANATIEARVNGGSYAAVSSGSASTSLPLNVGINTVDVRVTAQDGMTQKTYTVTVTRMAQLVANLTATQRPGTKLVDITYDLAAPSFGSAAVTLEVSNDGGTTWSVPVASATGAVGWSVTPGTGKTIVWNAGSDWSRSYSTQMQFRVVAVDGFSPIPGGSFTMGMTDGSIHSHAPSITVTVSPFFIQQTETTKAQWDEVTTWAWENGYPDLLPGEAKASDHPVQTVTWWDVVKWCNARSEKEGLTPVYTVSGAVMRGGLTPPEANWSANGYRLPTDAEWEKAARGGVSGKRFPWGTDTISHAQANYTGDSSFAYDQSEGNHPAYFASDLPYTSPAGTFEANRYGLYDMAGNLWEWCWDYWVDTPSNNTVDPRGPTSGSLRARRGGSWNSVAPSVACAWRDYDSPNSGWDEMGFRLVRSSVGTGIPQTASLTLDTRDAPTVNTPTATSITATAATLGGNVTADGGTTITERGVIYSSMVTNNDPLISDTGVTKVTATGTTGVFTAQLSGLAPGTGYSYKAYAINSQGTTYTTVATFTTLSNVTTPTSTSITATGATVGGTVVSLAGSRAVERGVVYSNVVTNPDPQLEGLGVIKLPRSGSIGSFTVAASGLSPSTAYAYRGYLTTSIGTSYSVVGYFTTDTPVTFTAGIGTVSNRVIRGGESQLFVFDLAQSSAAAFSTTGASPVMQWELRDALNALVDSGTGNVDFSGVLALGSYRLRITNPGSSTETFSLNLDASTLASPRPDISVGLDPTASSGVDLYDPPAPQQSVLAISTKAAIKNVFFRIDNDGPLPDAMRINGPGSDSRFRVAYVLAGRNVTAAVIAGTAATPVLAAADAPVPLFVRISPTRKNPNILRKVVVNQRPTWIYGRETFGPNGLTVRATTDPTLSDTATFQLNTVP
jgi:sulfatase modifying factor 1